MKFRASLRSSFGRGTVLKGEKIVVTNLTHSHRLSVFKNSSYGPKLKD